MSMKILAILFFWFVLIFENITSAPAVRNKFNNTVENGDILLSNKMIINVPVPQKLKHECPKNHVWIKNSCRFRVS